MEPDRLPEWMMSRRGKLKLSVRRLAGVAGVQPETWRGWERGTTSPKAGHYAAIELALQWTAGSVAAIRDGGEPTPLPPVPAAQGEPEDLDPAERAVWAGLSDHEPDVRLAVIDHLRALTAVLGREDALVQVGTLVGYLRGRRAGRQRAA